MRNVRSILKKEMTLTASVLSYIFILFGAMALIPNYPILVGGFFVCFGIFHTFQSARESNDVLYSAMLPVKKTDVVKSKYIFVFVIQLAAFLLFSISSALRIGILNRYSPYIEGALMNANLVFLGFVLMIYTAFNVLFVGGFYKTAYKLGVPFLEFSISAFIIIALGESLHFIPRLSLLNADFHPIHLLIFAAAGLVYVTGTLLSLHRAQHSFDTIDL